MQIHIKYRVHGILDKPLPAGSIVELDEATARELIHQGAAEELDTVLPLPNCQKDLAKTPKNAKAGKNTVPDVVPDTANAEEKA